MKVYKEVIQLDEYCGVEMEYTDCINCGKRNRGKMEYCDSQCKEEHELIQMYVNE